MYVGGYGASELKAGSVVSSRELCPVGFLLVGESPAVLLSCRMLIVVMMGKWPDDSAC